MIVQLIADGTRRSPEQKVIVAGNDLQVVRDCAGIIPIQILVPVAKSEQPDTARSTTDVSTKT